MKTPLHIHDGMADASNGQRHTPYPSKRFKGKYKTILLSCTSLIIPFAIISAVILGLCFHLRVQQGSGASSDLVLPVVGGDDSSYIYVNIKATRLARVVSTYTNVLTYVATFAIILSSYPVALSLLEHSKPENSEKLLTPYQLSLVLGFVENGGLVAIWAWIKYVLRPASKRQRAHQPLPAVGLGLTAIFTAILGLLIFATEWWLHFAIQSVDFTQVVPLDPSAGLYSNSLPSNCLDTNNSYHQQELTSCSLNASIRGGTLINPLTALEVLKNISSTMSANLGPSNQQYVFLGDPSNGALASHDFSAQTYSVQTQCQLVTKECGLSRDLLTNGVSIPWTCEKYPAFSGDLLGNTFKIRYFTDASGSSNETETMDYVNSNPFFFGVNGKTLDAAGAALVLKNSDEFVSLEFGGLAYAMFCSATVYDTTYTVLNGTVASFDVENSNTSVATMLVMPVLETGAANTKLKDTVDLAALSRSPQDFEDTFSRAYSAALLSLSAGVLVPSPALRLQQHSKSIVTRVSKAPLYTLLALSAVFIIFGILLGGVALVAASSAEDVEEVRQRLSSRFLVAEKFEGEEVKKGVEGLEEYFEEFGERPRTPKRVGVVARGNGGWEVMEPMDVRVEAQGMRGDGGV